MADAEIKVKVKAYDEGFAAGVAEVRKETDKLRARLEKANEGSMTFGKALGNLKSLAGGLLPAIAGVTTAIEGFKRTINATQTTADDFERATTGMQAGVEHFFQTLADGDWSNFLEGLQLAINKGRELYDVMDTLGDMNWAFGMDNPKLKKEINDLKVALRSDDLSLEEKERLEKELNKKVEEYAAKMEAVANESIKGYRATMSAATGMPFDEQADELYRESQMHIPTANSKIIDRIVELEKKLKESGGLSQNIMYSPTVGMISDRTGTEAYKKSAKNAESYRKELERLRAEYPKHALAAKYIDKIKDEERDKALDLWKSGYNGLLDASNMRVQMIRPRTYLKGLQNKSVGKSVPSARELTAVELWEQLPEAERQALTAQKPAVIPITPVLARTPEIIAGLEKEIDQLTTELTSAADAESRRRIKAKIAQKQSDIKEMRGGITVQGTIPIPKLPDPKEGLNDILSANLQLVDSFSSLGAAIGAMSGESDNAITAITQWVGTLLSSVGTAIPAIEALAAVHRDKANAQAADAATGAGSAVASTPIVGPIMAVSAIAGVIAAMASIPKFATGGVVRGASHTGDKILARLNAGELVLNTAQQTRLGHIIDRADGNTIGGQVEFKIRGEELVGVLNKHGRRTSRT